MSVRVIKEEIFLVETRDRDASNGFALSGWTYRSRHRTAKAAHRARGIALGEFARDTKHVRVVRMTIETRTEVLVNQEEIRS